MGNCRAAISSGLYKTVILDELNPTVDFELLPVEPIVQTLLRKPSETEVIITGDVKTNLYFDLASVHSEMVCHKHYAEKGVDLKRELIIILINFFVIPGFNTSSILIPLIPNLFKCFNARKDLFPLLQNT